jgi:MATE family, multidrug efflux pump
MRDLTEGPLTGHLIHMAVPIGVGMLVMTLYHLVDLYFVSQLGDQALAGVAAASNAMFLMMALTQSLSVGTVALVSHASGAKDQDQANLIFNQAVGVALGLAVFVLVAGYLGLADSYMGAVGADAEVIANGRQYLFWVIPAFAFGFGSAAMGVALQGTGIVKPTMVVQLITVVINLILTPILIAGWGTGMPLGVVGAGLSTAIAAAVGLILMATYFHRLEHYVGFHPTLWRPRWSAIRRMAAIGLPSGGEFALMFVYITTIYAVIGGFGSEAQAGFGIGIRVMQALFLPGMAIAFAVPAVAGQNFGARNPTRVRETFRSAAMINIVIMAALMLIAQVSPTTLVGAFTDQPAVEAVAAVFISVISFNFIATGLIFTCSGMFQGLGNTIPALISTATRIATFVVPAFWLAAQPDFRIEQVWTLSVVTVWLQLVLSLFLLRREMRRRLDFAPDDAEPVVEPV